MSNLSQQKREKMLKFLETLKEQNIYNEEAIVALKEEAIVALKEIELELKSKKYGLVWEKHEEEVDIQMKENIPVFVEVKDKEIQVEKNKKYNFLLEGDNLHSLILLEKTHKEKIDVIYIDPPYNTKNKEFIYNDKMIGEEDGYRHSKWLSFMSERLEIAKELLAENGIIFISIDDNEQAQLKLLCDSIFGEGNFIDSIIWKKTENIKMDSKFLSQNKDYILVYRKTDKVIEFNKEKSTIDRFKLEDDKGRYYLRKLDSLSSTYSRGMDYVIEYNGTSYYPGGSKEEWKKRQKETKMKKAPTWLWSKKKYEKGLEEGEIVFKNGNVYNKVRYDGKAKKPFINIQKLVSQQTAQRRLDKLLGGRKFDHPKPTELIKWLILLVKNNKSATILDFFAGLVS